jgi:chromosome segregation ATPase
LGTDQVVRTAKIEALKRKFEQLKDKRAQVTAQRDVSEKQLSEVEAQIAKAGYTPNDLPDVIARLETEVDESISKAEQLIKSVEEKLNG